MRNYGGGKEREASMQRGSILRSLKGEICRSKEAQGVWQGPSERYRARRPMTLHAGLYLS